MATTPQAVSRFVCVDAAWYSSFFCWFYRDWEQPWRNAGWTAALQLVAVETLVRTTSWSIRWHTWVATYLKWKLCTLNIRLFLGWGFLVNRPSHCFLVRIGILGTWKGWAFASSLFASGRAIFGPNCKQHGQGLRNLECCPSARYLEAC